MKKAFTEMQICVCVALKHALRINESKPNTKYNYI